MDKPGVFAAEIIAERAAEVSQLDAVLTLYQEVDGRRTILARNDDYFSDDSLITMELDEGTYFLAVTSTGNVNFDPTVEGSGFGGTTQGDYDLRLDFRPRVDNFLTDATGTAFDGDADGVPGGIYNYWMRVVGVENQVVVDKSAPDGGDGTLASPFNNLNEALTDPANGVEEGDIMRIVGNGGGDGDLSTVDDNLAYELGISDGIILSDGADFVVPRGLTVMVDGGAIFKMLKTNIHVGSSSVTIDRSGIGVTDPWNAPNITSSSLPTTMKIRALIPIRGLRPPMPEIGAASLFRTTLIEPKSDSITSRLASI